MIKRINNEIEKLIKETNCMNVTVTYENVNSKNFKCNVIIDNKKFVLSDSYPFNAPKVFILKDNNYEYIHWKSPTCKIRKLLYEFNRGCLCCETILCNWSPAYGFHSILNEITANNILKRNVKYHMLTNDILNKYKYISKSDIPKTLILDYLISN